MYCVNLLKREKKKYYNNLNIKIIVDNKTFWKTIKPLFSEKSKSRQKITLIEDDQIITDDTDIAELMNNFFSETVTKLNIVGYDKDLEIDTSIYPIEQAIMKFKDHPSVLIIKENISEHTFSFNHSNEIDIWNKIKLMKSNKPSTFNNIPTKILIENVDICSSLICRIINISVTESTFPSLLKNADITPVHKKDDKLNINNFRPISILPSITKTF